MSHIVNFPTKQVRDWAIMERGLETILSEAKISDTAKIEILERINDFFNLVQMEFAFSISENLLSSVDSELNRFSLALQERSNKLILDRILIEIEVCKLKGLL